MLFASQRNLFRTMWTDRAKGLFIFINFKLDLAKEKNTQGVWVGTGDRCQKLGPRGFSFFSRDFGKKQVRSVTQVARRQLNDFHAIIPYQNCKDVFSLNSSMTAIWYVVTVMKYGRLR